MLQEQYTAFSCKFLRILDARDNVFCTGNFKKPGDVFCRKKKHRVHIGSVTRFSQKSNGNPSNDYTAMIVTLKQAIQLLHGTAQDPDPISFCALQFCPSQEYFHFTIVITAFHSCLDCKAYNSIKFLPMLIERHGAQFLSFNFFDCFPAVTEVKTNLFCVHKLI